VNFLIFFSGEDVTGACDALATRVHETIDLAGMDAPPG